MIPGHECSAFCAGDEHCEVCWTNSDHTPNTSSRFGPYEADRRHFDAAYRRRYGARVVRCAPAREAEPIAAILAREPDDPPLTQLEGHGIGAYPWLIWFVPPGPAAAAFAAREEAEYRARLAAAVGRSAR